MALARSRSTRAGKPVLRRDFARLLDRARLSISWPLLLPFDKNLTLVEAPAGGKRSAACHTGSRQESWCCQCAAPARSCISTCDLARESLLAASINLRGSAHDTFTSCGANSLREIHSASPLAPRPPARQQFLPAPHETPPQARGCIVRTCAVTNRSSVSAGGLTSSLICGPSVCSTPVQKSVASSEILSST